MLAGLKPSIGGIGDADARPRRPTGFVQVV
jgi:hypothetical protein